MSDTEVFPEVIVNVFSETPLTLTTITVEPVAAVAILAVTLLKDIFAGAYHLAVPVVTARVPCCDKETV